MAKEERPGFSYRSDRVGGREDRGPIASRPRRQRAACHRADSHAIQIAFQPGRRAIITRMRREHALSRRSLSLSLGRRLCARVPCPRWRRSRRRRTILFLLIASRRNRSSPTGLCCTTHRGEPGRFHCPSDVSRCPRMRLLNHRCNPVTIMTTALHRLARVRACTCTPRVCRIASASRRWIKCKLKCSRSEAKRSERESRFEDKIAA